MNPDKYLANYFQAAADTVQIRKAKTCYLLAQRFSYISIIICLISSLIDKTGFPLAITICLLIINCALGIMDRSFLSNKELTKIEEFIFVTFTTCFKAYRIIFLITIPVIILLSVVKILKIRTLSLIFWTLFFASNTIMAYLGSCVPLTKDQLKKIT